MLVEDLAKSMSAGKQTAVSFKGLLIQSITLNSFGSSISVEADEPRYPGPVPSGNWSQTVVITKTSLYNFDPLKPHFYIVKLGFTGVYIIFLISAQRHRLWVLVSTNVYPQSMSLSRNMKNIRVFGLKIFSFRGEIVYIFE